MFIYLQHAPHLLIYCLLYWSLCRVFAMPLASGIFLMNAVGIRHAVGIGIML